MPFAVGDLEDLIKNECVILQTGDIKQYMIMLLLGIQYIHNKFILHRDLKPSNCLIFDDNSLKISDFGLSREYGSLYRQLSYQACTIWYRSPELLFGANNYSIGLDIWSVGCIFAELLLRTPIFNGINEIDQIGKIFRILGTPNYSSLTTTIDDNNNNISQLSTYWKDYEMLPKFRRYEPNDPFPIDQLFKAQSFNAKQLFLSLCKYDPCKRLTATQALNHDYFTEHPLPTLIKLLPSPKQTKSNSITPQPSKTDKMEID